MVGPNSEISNTTYYPDGRVATMKSVYGAVTQVQYDPNGVTSTATVNGRWTRTTVDSFGRPVKVEQGSGGVVKTIVDTEYAPCACSPLGKVKRVSMPYGPGGTPFWTTYEYDEVRRISAVTTPGGARTTYEYLVLETTITAPRARSKKYQRDIFGNLVKVTEDDPENSNPDVKYATLYTYTNTDKLSQVSMTRGGVTQTRTWNLELESLDAAADQRHSARERDRQLHVLCQRPAERTHGCKGPACGAPLRHAEPSD